MNKGRCVVCTPRGPGAIAIVSLLGEACEALGALTGRKEWPAGTSRVVQVRDIDECVAVRVTEELGQIMPHGGPAMMRELLSAIAGLGVEIVQDDRHLTRGEIRALFPEAEDEVEAMALHTMGRAESPMAIELLLAQKERWRGQGGIERFRPTIDDHERGRRLKRLIEPALVVLAGPANVGKSTLTNRLIGRAISIAADAPGTTRDYTTGLVDMGGVVVRWHDTPGVKTASDELEQRAMAIARRIILKADLLVAASDAVHDWPALPRPADVRVGMKSDVSKRGDCDVVVSGVEGTGLRELAEVIRKRVVPEKDLANTRPWVFDERLLG